MVTPDTGAPARLLVVSDFNAELFSGIVANHDAAPTVKARAAGFGAVVPVLLNADDPAWDDADILFAWTRPEAVSETFARAVQLHQVDTKAALVEVDAFCQAIVAAASRVSATLVAAWHLPADIRGYGLLERRDGLGLRALLARMNERMAQRLAEVPGVFVLDVANWFECREPLATKMWYLAKVPYSNDVLKAAAADVKAAIRAVRGQSRKVIICDLDDTIWGGTVGETGPDGLRLGGHDAVGEAFVDFQRELKALTRRGVLLAIVSKNTESVAMEAIDSHPEMVLRRSDFAAWRINWEDKAGNIADLMQELGLGLDAAVFLDDNPLERERVMHALPEVLVPALPPDRMMCVTALRRLNCFDTATVSEEDRSRAGLYRAENERRAATAGAAAVESLDDWLDSLDITIHIEPINAANLERTAQLFNKTNQMNLRTRRMTDRELIDWANDPRRRVWTFRVADRFGDAGLTAIASVEADGDRASVADFLLSCRVMGRRVEETVLYHLVESARELGADSLVAEFLPTRKNAPCLAFLRRSGFVEEPEHRFYWDLSRDYPAPRAVTMSGANDP